MLRKLIVAFALLSLVSCGDDIEKRYKDSLAKLPPPPGRVTGGTRAHPGESRPTKWSINEAGARIDYVLNATNEQHELLGKGDASKRTYALDGAPAFITKQDPGEIKIKAPDGTLKWKVRVDGNTIKISNNEENTNAITLTTKGNQTFATGPDGSPFGSTVFQGGDNTTIDATDQMLSVMGSKALHPPYVLTAVTTIPAPDKYVIMLELLDMLP